MTQKVYTILDRRVKLVQDNPAHPAYCGGCVFSCERRHCEITDEHEQRAGVPQPCYAGSHHYETAE